VEDLKDVDIPHDMEGMLYVITITLRQRDWEPRIGPPSKYMTDYVRAAKGVYFTAANICKHNPEFHESRWIDIITNSRKSSADKSPSLYNLDHYRAFLSEISVWLLESSKCIGELHYLEGRSRLVRWMRRHRISLLTKRVKKYYETLDNIREGYSLTFRPTENTVNER